MPVGDLENIEVNNQTSAPSQRQYEIIFPQAGSTSSANVPGVVVCDCFFTLCRGPSSHLFFILYAPFVLFWAMDIIGYARVFLGQNRV